MSIITANEPGILEPLRQKLMTVEEFLAIPDDEKIDEYLACGVPMVWIADPHFRTITIHRPAMAPEFFTEAQVLSAENELPGFSVIVRNLFE